MIPVPFDLYRPDPLWHRYISFVKSGLRILAATFLGTSWFGTSGVLFLLAEICGIIEEVV